MVDKEGPKLAHADMVVFIDPNDPRKPAIDQVLPLLGPSKTWSDALGEYGVGPPGAITMLPLPTLPSSFARADLEAAVAQSVHDLRFKNAAGVADGGADAGSSVTTKHAETLYIVLLPPTATVTNMPCTEILGYHTSILATPTDEVPLAVVEGICTAAEDTLSAAAKTLEYLSHEIFESATNPFPASAPAWSAVDDGHAARNVGLGGFSEIGDLCLGRPVPLDGLPVLTVGNHQEVLSLQAAWSNLRAAAGKDPCGAEDGVPFFLPMPVLTEQAKLNAALTAPAVTIATGEMAIVDIRVASDRPTGDLTFFAYDVASKIYHHAEELTFTVDRTTARNGDVLHLSITRARAPRLPTLLHGSAFAVGLNDGTGLSQTSYGFVAVP